MTFYERSTYGPEPSVHEPLIEVYGTFAEVYNPSIKDLDIMNSRGINRGVTVKFRNPYEDYVPQNHHLALIDHIHFTDQLWEVEDIRPDTTGEGFMTILLKGVETN